MARALSGQRRSDSGRGLIRRRRREGAARQRGVAGRFALRHGLDRIARDEAELDMMSECDTLLMVGSSFPYSEFLPKEGQARGVQIDIDGRLLSIRYPMEVNLMGDSAETLRALIPLLTRKDRSLLAQMLEKEIDEWWKVLEARAMNDADPINPQRVFWELSPRLPDNCIITADSGSATNWFARDLKIRRGMMASLSGNLATMCPGVPYAIAANFVFPNASRSHASATARCRCLATTADYDRKVLERMERSAADRSGPEQSRSEPGDLGAARA